MVCSLPTKMTTIREKINSHLPIVLQFLSTASLVVIALSAICGSQSLKKLSSVNGMPDSVEMLHDH
tara:strand:- start:41 stop:238 length:198 start_codon:yes stop_codon:yes gene_type:complete